MLLATHKIQHSVKGFGACVDRCIWLCYFSSFLLLFVVHRSADRLTVLEFLCMFLQQLRIRKEFSVFSQEWTAVWFELVLQFESISIKKAKTTYIYLDPLQGAKSFLYGCHKDKSKHIFLNINYKNKII